MQKKEYEMYYAENIVNCYINHLQRKWKILSHFFLFNHKILFKSKKTIDENWMLNDVHKSIRIAFVKSYCTLRLVGKKIKKIYITISLIDSCIRHMSSNIAAKASLGVMIFEEH